MIAALVYGVMTSTIRHMTPGGKLWPSDLDPIPSPPTQLWCRGQPEILGAIPRVAIVGSRSPTPYGEAQARRFAHALGRRGITIVSGMARGVDHVAHNSALDAGGRTIAVLGSGVDKPWPTGALAERMLSEGLLLSEFEPGRGPRRHHFPLRNRIISGLSWAVIVIEAAQNSGSLITAHWALEQGRNVYALPGRVDHPMARGCHRLIREGASLLESPDELLRDMLAEDQLLPFEETRDPPSQPKHTGELSRSILSALRGDTLGVDELCARLKLPVGRVLAELTRLELDNAVVRAPGGLYRLAMLGG